MSAGLGLSALTRAVGVLEGVSTTQRPWHEIIVDFQIPTVCFILLSSALARRFFGTRSLRYAVAGWFTNLGYLCWHNFAGVTLPADLLSAGPTLERALSLVASCFWITAGTASESSLKGLRKEEATLCAILSVPLLIILARGSFLELPSRIIVELSLIAIETRAIFQLKKAYRSTLKAAGLSAAWPRTYRLTALRYPEFLQLLMLGLNLYAAVQGMQILSLLPSSSAQELGLVLGFGGGLLSKVLIANGLFVLFIVTSHRVEADRARLSHSRSVFARLSHEAGTPLAQMALYLRIAFTEARQKRPLFQTLEELEGVHQRLCVIVAAGEDEVRDSQLAEATLEHPAVGVQSIVRVANVNVIVEKAIAATKDTRWTESAVVTWVVRYAGRCCVLCNPPEMQQVVQNLLGNALDVLAQNDDSHHREICVTTRNVRASKEESDLGSVEVIIEDTGNGVAQDISERIFDDGFTTKDGSNRGHGLAIVRQLMSKNGGGVVLVSPAMPKEAPERGTRFLLSWPRVRCERLRGERT